MHAYINRAMGSSMGWLLVGLAVLPLLTASAESNVDSRANERLAQLLAKHDVRSVIYGASAPSSDCKAHDDKEGAR